MPFGPGQDPNPIQTKQNTMFDSKTPGSTSGTNNKKSSSLIFGIGGTNSTIPVTGVNTKDTVLIGAIAGVSDNLLDTIKEDSEQNLKPDVTLSATAPDKVVEDIIKKINKGESSYNFIPSSFDVFLLQNSKNKVLFNFTRPVFSYNLSIASPVEQSNLLQFNDSNNNIDNSGGLNENKALTPIVPKQIDVSNFPILFYKTKNKPASLEEIKVETNLYKTLIPAKKELSVVDFLDVNVDYYFYASPGQGLVDKIKDLLITEFDLSIGDFKIITAEEKGILTDYIYRVKIIKDGELYFLEKDVFDPNKKEDKKKTKNFFGTILAEPKYEFVDTTVKNFSKTNSKLPFTSGDAVFDSGENYPYIKLRFKSKKSNRKFDVNLRYTIANTPPVELSENNIGQEVNSKYTKLKKFIPKVPTLELKYVKYFAFDKSEQFTNTEISASIVLEQLIKELNIFFSNDNKKSIIYAYKGNNKVITINDILYQFIGYNLEDIDNFLNNFKSTYSESYIKLKQYLDEGKNIIEDTILQL